MCDYLIKKQKIIDNVRIKYNINEQECIDRIRRNICPKNSSNPKKSMD